MVIKSTPDAIDSDLSVEAITPESNTDTAANSTAQIIPEEPISDNQTQKQNTTIEQSPMKASDTPLTLSATKDSQIKIEKNGTKITIKAKGKPQNNMWEKIKGKIEGLMNSATASDTGKSSSVQTLGIRQAVKEIVQKAQKDKADLLNEIDMTVEQKAGDKNGEFKTQYTWKVNKSG